MRPGPSFRRTPESILILPLKMAARGKMDPSVRWDDGRNLLMKSRTP